MPLISLVIRENIRNTLYHLGEAEEKRKWKTCDSLGKGSKTKKISIIMCL